MTKIRIRELREEKKMSQEQLAKSLGFKANTISNWERGTREPDVQTIKKLADIFGVSTDYLLGYKDY